MGSNSLWEERSLENASFADSFILVKSPFELCCIPVRLGVMVGHTREVSEFDSLLVDPAPPFPLSRPLVTFFDFLACYPEFIPLHVLAS